MIGDIAHRKVVALDCDLIGFNVDIGMILIGFPMEHLGVIGKGRQ